MSEAVRLPAPPLVVCDANVLYSIVLTDLILSLGVGELVRPRWTERIHAEWMRTLLAHQPTLEPTKIARRRQQMDEAIEDCVIAGYEALIPHLRLPDPNDRHVLAAAIHARARVILTYNQRDFPRRVLTPHGITAQHPDDFLMTVMQRSSTAVRETLEEMRARKTRPSLSPTELLRKLANQQLPKFVAALRATGYGC